MISVLIPALNEETTIVEVVESHYRELLNLNFSEFELVVLNDGSTDATSEILKKKFNTNPRIRVYENKKPSGIASACSQLLDLANGEWVYFTSADGQFPAECLVLMSQHINEGAELIVGDRSDRSKVYGWKRRIVSYMYRRLSRIMFQVDPVDPGSVKIIRKASFPKDLISRSVTRDLELILVFIKQKRKVVFVPIPFFARTSGKENGGSIIVISKAFVDLVKLRIKTPWNMK
jgi:glycosyltransferase involved in cell wall biosynthesis